MSSFGENPRVENKQIEAAKRSHRLVQRGVDIAELSTRSYAAAHTGAPMFSVQMIVNVPSRLHIGVLREEFMDFCDHLNLDAIFEPVKS